MENGIVNVARGLDPAEFEIHVCCLNSTGAFAERLPQPENVHVLGRKSGFDIRATFKLSRLLSRLKPHVIHSHNLGSLTYASLASAFGWRHPILHGEHGLLPPEQCTPRRIRQRAILYRCCRCIHTVSVGQKQQLADFRLPVQRIVALINGVDTNRFQPGDKAPLRGQLDLPEDAQVMGIVGRFVGLKRHLDLLEAFDVLAVKNDKAHLLIVGSGGAESDRIHERVWQSPFKSRIHLAGFQSDPRPFYQAMDILVVPSIIEGMSNVVLEAMACGIPVLAHNACGNAEMLVHGSDGFVQDLSTAQNLRVAIQNILADSTALPKIGSQARQNVVKKFSIAEMISNYERLYWEVAKSRRSVSNNY